MVRRSCMIWRSRRDVYLQHQVLSLCIPLKFLFSSLFFSSSSSEACLTSAILHTRSRQFKRSGGTGISGKRHEEECKRSHPPSLPLGEKQRVTQTRWQLTSRFLLRCRTCVIVASDRLCVRGACQTCSARLRFKGSWDTYLTSTHRDDLAVKQSKRHQNQPCSIILSQKEEKKKRYLR